jgi:hypothetical protein
MRTRLLVAGLLVLGICGDVSSVGAQRGPADVSELPVRRVIL